MFLSGDRVGQDEVAAVSVNGATTKVATAALNIQTLLILPIDESSF